MQEFLEVLDQRIYKLRQIIVEKEKKLKKVPEGTIHISGYGDKVQFYLHNNGERKYMGEKEKPLVQRLCQKDYDQKILRSAEKELKKLEKIRKNYPGQTCEEIYNNIHIQRKKLVQPIWLPDEEYIKEWEQKEYRGKMFWEDLPEHYTDKGERVRSKSEVLIANALNKNKIPYRYEQPIYLNGWGTIHPDFTVLNVRLRKEKYWEHLGMMDNYEYAEEALKRIDMYEKNDIFPGDKLIITHETLKQPINSKNIEKIIEQYLK